MDTVGNSKQVKKGTVNEINEFAGWKAVTENGETGKICKLQEKQKVEFFH